MNGHAHFDEALAGYALDALDPRERAEFEAHLATCATCQAALPDLIKASAALGETIEPVSPPDSLKARALARAMAQPQSMPSRTAANVESQSGGRTQWIAMAAGIVLVAGLAIYAVSLRSQIAALRDTVAASSARADTLRDELVSLRRESARTMTVVGVLSAPNLMTVNLQGQGTAAGTTGRAYVSPGRGLVFTADRLPTLPPDRVYQLWAIPADGVPVSAGVFQAEPSGALGLAADVPQAIGAARTMAVTVEPGPQGSPGPTTPVLMAGSVGG